MREVEFRDGRKQIPDHLADLLAKFETYTMTYEQAVDKLNGSFLQERLGKAQNNLVRDHLARHGLE